MKEEIKFKVGDRVFSPHFGKGIVTDIDDRPNIRYPIEVQWEPESDVFTLDGKYSLVDEVPDFGITPMKVVKCAEGEKFDDAINPKHYKVDGIPEAIEIMEHLMTKGQLEGFLWGNIIKYSYRYGRKGNKKETAGKIEWYAQRLKELDSKEKEK